MIFIFHNIFFILFPEDILLAPASQALNARTDGTGLTVMTK